MSSLSGCWVAARRRIRRLSDVCTPARLADALRLQSLRILRRRALAEEALQDVFISILGSKPVYTALLGAGAMAWMMSIARYRAIDLLRRERFAPTLVGQPGGVPHRRRRTRPGYPVQRLASVRRSDAGDVLALLSEQQAHCLERHTSMATRRRIYRTTDGRSPLGTVKSWIRRALRGVCANVWSRDMTPDNPEVIDRLASGVCTGNSARSRPPPLRACWRARTSIVDERCRFWEARLHVPGKEPRARCNIRRMSGPPSSGD